MKLTGCTSLRCQSFDCEYCRKCSHAIYRGSGKDENLKMWTWDFSPMFGPEFIDKHGEPLKNPPVSETHPAWMPFELWHYRFLHGKRHPVCGVYNNMKTRCYNEKNKQYYRYGGRGIKICAAWLKNQKKFYMFALSNGWAEDLEIDRINNNGNYTPGNCRFVTGKVNCSNKVETKRSQKARSELGKSRRKKVRNITTGEMFLSATHAAKHLGLYENAVRKAICDKHMSGGCQWEYV